MKFSFYYRQKNQNLFVFQTLFVGFGLSLIDVYFEFKMDPLPVNKGCAAVGCFTSLTFRYYWGSTNMVNWFPIIYLSTNFLGIEPLSSALHKFCCSWVEETEQNATQNESKGEQSRRKCCTGMLLEISLFWKTTVWTQFYVWRTKNAFQSKIIIHFFKQYFIVQTSD